MWENETSYKLSLKKNLIYEHCQEAYKQSQSFDVVFITQNKYEIPAHRIILAISSDFIKSCADFQDHQMTIMLPDYSAALVESFVQFLYSGETRIDLSSRADFISLCEAMMVNVPDLILIDEEETIMETFEEEKANVEQVEEWIEEPSVDDEMIVVETEEALPLEEESGLVEAETSPSLKPPDIIYKPLSSDISEATVHRAIEAIHKGENLMEIARRFGIPKSTLYRWKKKIECSKADGT